MPVTVDLDELLEAFEWVHAGEVAFLDAKAYVDKRTGKIHWCGEGIDEEVPEDFDDDSLYVAVPRKNELELGRTLALDFVDAQLPECSATVRGYFRGRGAYRRLKNLLASVGQLDAWHRYQDTAKAESLKKWGAENGFVVSEVRALLRSP